MTRYEWPYSYHAESMTTADDAYCEGDSVAMDDMGSGIYNFDPPPECPQQFHKDYKAGYLAAFVSSKCQIKPVGAVPSFIREHV